MNNKVFAVDLEDAIRELEGIRVVIRAPKNMEFDPYSYKRRISETTSVKDWANGRLKPIIGDVDYTLIAGDGEVPHGRTSMKTLRESYK